MRILVTGGRDFQNKKALWDVLNALTVDQDHFTTYIEIVHGRARGADTLAGEWAKLTRNRCTEFPADWNGPLGKGAGFARNQQMADYGADICIACPGGNGTEDMIARARKAGIPVLRIVP